MSRPGHIRLMKCSQAVIGVMKGQTATKGEKHRAAIKGCRAESREGII